MLTAVEAELTRRARTAALAPARDHLGRPNGDWAEEHKRINVLLDRRERLLAAAQ